MGGLGRRAGAVKEGAADWRPSRRPASIRSAITSAIMTVVKWVLARARGNTDASTTRRPRRPRTRQSGSTTARGHRPRPWRSAWWRAGCHGGGEGEGVNGRLRPSGRRGSGAISPMALRGGAAGDLPAARRTPSRRRSRSRGSSSMFSSTRGWAAGQARRGGPGRARSTG